MCYPSPEIAAKPPPLDKGSVGANAGSKQISSTEITTLLALRHR
jgi:hypothetical protein